MGCTVSAVDLDGLDGRHDCGCGCGVASCVGADVVRSATGVDTGAQVEQV